MLELLALPPIPDRINMYTTYLAGDLAYLLLSAFAWLSGDCYNKTLAFIYFKVVMVSPLRNILTLFLRLS